MDRDKLRNSATVFRDEMLMRDRIRELLKKQPLTIPQLAEALDLPSREVTTWVMAMRRYGLLQALPKGRADDYYEYGLAAED